LEAPKTRVFEQQELETFLKPLIIDMANKFSEFESKLFYEKDSHKFSRNINMYILQKCWTELWADFEKKLLVTKTSKILITTQINRVIEAKNLLSDLFDDFHLTVQNQEDNHVYSRVLKLMELLTGDTKKMIEVWETTLTDQMCASEEDRKAHWPHISRVGLRKAIKARSKFLKDKEAKAFIKKHPSKSIGTKLKSKKKQASKVIKGLFSGKKHTNEAKDGNSVSERADSDDSGEE
jgi:hypothetical protein